MGVRWYIQGDGHYDKHVLDAFDGCITRLGVVVIQMDRLGSECCDVIGSLPFRKSRPNRSIFGKVAGLVGCLGDRRLLPNELQEDLVLLLRGQEPLAAASRTIGPSVLLRHVHILPDGPEAPGVWTDQTRDLWL